MTYHKLFTSPKALVNTLTIFIAGIFWYYTSSAISASNTVLIPHVISRADYSKSNPFSPFTIPSVSAVNTRHASNNPCGTHEKRSLTTHITQN